MTLRGALSRSVGASTRDFKISYESKGFPPSAVGRPSSDLYADWADLIWAAATIGRPNTHFVLQHGKASFYELVFRVSLIRMAVAGGRGYSPRLFRTDAFQSLDPTEKGAVSYFAGMTVCKLFADRLLRTPWLLHLDIWKDKVGARLSGRQRPDLIGKEYGTNNWHAFECKGRSAPPDNDTKRKAKLQASRVTVDGNRCVLQVGAITFLERDVLKFYWQDPPADEAEPLQIGIPPGVWQHYYRPIVDSVPSDIRGAMLSEVDIWTSIEPLDIEVSIHPRVAAPLFDGLWDEAVKIAEDSSEQIESRGYRRDGLALRCGLGWANAGRRM